MKRQSKTKTTTILSLFSFLILFQACSTHSPEELSILGQKVVGHCNVTLTTSPDSPQAQGKSITLTAQGTCITGTPEYKFYMRKPTGSWYVARDWATSNALIWNTLTENKGSYLFQVWIRREGESLPYEGASPSLAFEFVSPVIQTCSTTTATTTLASPQIPGVSIGFLYHATCSAGSQPEYKLYHRPPGGSWSVIHDWNSADSFAWNTTSNTPQGTHLFQVWTRAQGNSSTYESVGSFTFKLNQPTCDTVYAKPSTTAPIPEGTSVSWTLSTNCLPSTSVEYKIYHKLPNGTWLLEQDWSSSTEHVSLGLSPTGNHSFQVWMRKEGNTNTYDAVTPLYTIQTTTSPHPPWIRSLTGYYCRIQDSTFDSDGNVYVTGIFHSQCTLGTTSISTTNLYDLFIAKIDKNGHTKWIKQVGSTGYVEGKKLVVDGVNVYLVGSFSETVTFGTTTLQAYSVYNSKGAFISKLDGNGNWMWTKQIGDTLGLWASDIKVGPNHNIYITGAYYYTTNFDSIKVPSISASSEEIYVGKMDTNGQWIWVTSAGGPGRDIGSQLAVDKDGDAYVSGYVYTGATFGPFSNTGPMGYLAKIDKNGVWKWLNRSVTGDVTVDANKNVYTSSGIRKSYLFGSSTITLQGNSDIVVAKADSQGNWLWATSATGGTNGEGNSYSITLDKHNNIYISGKISTSFTFGQETLTPEGKSAAFIAKIDDKGNWKWSEKIDGPSPNNKGDQSAQRIQIKNERILTSGYFQGNPIQFGSQLLQSNTTTEGSFIWSIPTP